MSDFRPYIVLWEQKSEIAVKIILKFEFSKFCFRSISETHKNITLSGEVLQKLKNWYLHDPLEVKTLQKLSGMYKNSWAAV